MSQNKNRRPSRYTRDGGKDFGNTNTVLPIPDNSNPYNRPDAVNIEREFAEALRRTRDPWNGACALAHVAIYENFFEFDPDGEGALIVAVEVEGELIDLVACRLN